MARRIQTIWCVYFAWKMDLKLRSLDSDHLEVRTRTCSKTESDQQPLTSETLHTTELGFHTVLIRRIAN